jgi:ubiquinone/menaquinone biosynthesis C-methylase UbiE
MGKPFIEWRVIIKSKSSNELFFGGSKERRKSMAHKFNPKNKEKLQSKERRQNLPPDKVLTEVGLQPGQVFIDIGCGVGYFSIPASKIVGSRGRVYALDTSVEMTEFLKAELKALSIKNVGVENSTEYGFPLKDSIGEMLLMSMVLHEVEDKRRFLQEAHRTLKSGGKIIILEWVKKETEQGPPLIHRLDPQETKDYLIEAGFKYPRLINIEDMAKSFYLIAAEA